MSVVASQITSVSIVCLLSLQAQIKENIKAPRHWPLCWEFTGEFPTQKASDAEKVSIWWRHHAFCESNSNIGDKGSTGVSNYNHNDNPTLCYQ